LQILDPPLAWFTCLLMLVKITSHCLFNCMMFRTKKQNADRRWLERTAHELDIELDNNDQYARCLFDSH